MTRDDIFRDDIFRMATEAGLVRNRNGYWEDDILRRANEAGLVANGYWEFDMNLLERFAALIKDHLISEGYRKCAEGQRTTQYCGQLEAAVAAEREACAQICDAKAKRNFNWGSENADKYHAQADWAEHIAVAIRARGEK